MSTRWFLVMLGLIGVAVVAVANAPAPHSEQDCIGGMHDTVSKLFAERSNGRETLLQIWDDKSKPTLKMQPDENLVLGCTAKAMTNNSRRVALEYGAFIARGERFVFYREAR